MGPVRKCQKSLCSPREKKTQLFRVFSKKQPFYIRSQEQVRVGMIKTALKSASLVGGEGRLVFLSNMGQPSHTWTWCQPAPAHFFPYSPPHALQLSGRLPELSLGKRAGPPACGHALCTAAAEWRPAAVHDCSPCLQQPAGVPEDSIHGDKRGLILLLRSKNGCLIEKLSFLNFSSLSTAEIPTCRLCLLTQALACSGAGVWDQSWYWRFSFRHQSVLRHSPPSPYSVLLSMAEAFPWEAA